jgi:hypothetical protein
VVGPGMTPVDSATAHAENSRIGHHQAMP